jgi:hypothetical protein
MLIWESPSVEREAIEALAAHAQGVAECLVRDDGTGSAILCERGEVPPGVREKRLEHVFSMGRSGPDAGPWIFAVGIRMPADFRDDLCAWYQHEHGPILLECPEWQGFQCFEMRVPHGAQLYVLHRLAARTALESEARKRSRDTSWFHRLSRHEWFDGPFERVLLRTIGLRSH